MHLPISPDAPLALRAAVGGVLALHIGGASLGIVAGGVALIARKGGRLHRAAGNLFFAAMLAMSAVGAVVSPMLHDRMSGLMGAFTFYLTLTAWTVVRRPAGSLGQVERGAGLAALAIAATAFTLGVLGSQAPQGLLDDQPYEMGFALALIAGLAALADLRTVRRGGLSGPPRLARHLWRMCAALFIAAGSAVGQPKVVALLPHAIRQSALLLFAPALAVLALMIFWLIRVRLPRRARATAIPLFAA
jgi:uncharacterized membrane protein